MMGRRLAVHVLAAGAAAAAFGLASGAAMAQSACPGNANALGVSRTVEIDTTGGPGFGLEQYKAHDFLLPKEVVLTFDDGPWPTTPAVLKALAAHCTKATFFVIGKHATYHPEILKQVAVAGHTVGTHTWSHRNLGNKKVTAELAKREIEMGISAAKIAMGQEPSSFFRFPALQDPPEQVKYLGTRNLAIFSMDLNSFDFKIRSQKGVITNVMRKLEKKGKGIILLHDFQKHTSQAVGDLLAELKAKGYKVVHMRSKAAVPSMEEFDKLVKAEFKAPPTDTRPTSMVVRTVPPAK